MALKTYTKADDIPEGLRGEYKQSGSVWVPDLADDHPVLVLNKTLKQEKDLEEAKVRKLKTDLDDALEAGKSSGLPRGHVAVPKADAELLSEVKALGAVADIKAKLTEHETLKTKVAETERTENRRKVAAELGYNEAAFLQLANLPDMEVREKDGKKSVVALVQEGDKTVEKPAKEYVEATFAPLLPALTSKGSVDVPTGGGGGNQGSDPFKAAREFGKQWNDTAKQSGDVASRFGLAKAAATE